MTQPSPADTLRAAADKLRKLASAEGLTPSPWSVHNPHGYPQAVHGTGQRPIFAEVLDDIDEPKVHAAYIAAMNPGVGAGLARLLERVASNAIETDHEHHTSPSWCNEDTCDLSAALAVARAILGEDQT